MGSDPLVLIEVPRTALRKPNRRAMMDTYGDLPFGWDRDYIKEAARYVGPRPRFYLAAGHEGLLIVGGSLRAGERVPVVAPRVDGLHEFPRMRMHSSGVDFFNETFSVGFGTWPLSLEAEP